MRRNFSAAAVESFSRDCFFLFPLAQSVQSEGAPRATRGWLAADDQSASPDRIKMSNEIRGPAPSQFRPLLQRREHKEGGGRKQHPQNQSSFLSLELSRKGSRLKYGLPAPDIRQTASRDADMFAMGTNGTCTKGKQRHDLSKHEVFCFLIVAAKGVR
jgi:hypothetical protein